MSLNLLSPKFAEQHQDIGQNCHPDPISHHLSQLVEQHHAINSVNLAEASHTPPANAWQLDMPRIDIVLAGSINIHYSTGEHHSRHHQFNTGDVLYIPNMGWSQPLWGEAATLLRLDIAPHKVEFSLHSWSGNDFSEVHKRPSVRRHQIIGNGLIQVLQELVNTNADSHTISLVIRSLLSHLMIMENAPDKLPSRQEELFHKITKYIDENYDQTLSREEVARIFHISPNYLSHIFQHQGKTSFKDYLCHKRMENAQRLLELNHHRVKQISKLCGFSDSNYFCRLFKQKTGVTPSQFRAGLAA
ncbi:AraC family transcriptional regulator (plasmid) [Photobacterium sp. DA100]|uniref:helix-turn-helix transcriptional regulator n=1 Tax=Photobacterium sp. DA100 TaxID=3027472 RepID=UPI00247A4DA6|nr:AraC family transcriptional regulator [Photobacterium sp. DA100]WEM44524.1 AraC family transcriptional regulator [Photobacterium sp. DA100]